MQTCAMMTPDTKALQQLRNRAAVLAYLSRLLGDKLLALFRAAWRRAWLSTGWLLARPRPAWAWARWFEHRCFPLRRWHLLVAGLTALQAARMALKFTGTWLSTLHARRALLVQMQSASSYEEFSRTALALDHLEGRSMPPWLATRAQRHLAHRTARLSRMEAAQDIAGLMWQLRQDGGRVAAAALGDAVESAEVRCFTVPQAVTDYICAVQAALDSVCESHGEAFVLCVFPGDTKLRGSNMLQSCRWRSAWHSPVSCATCVAAQAWCSQVGHRDSLLMPRGLAR